MLESDYKSVAFFFHIITITVFLEIPPAGHAPDVKQREKRLKWLASHISSKLFSKVIPNSIPKMFFTFLFNFVFDPDFEQIGILDHNDLSSFKFVDVNKQSVLDRFSSDLSF
jgi:hypothetical protein